MNDEERKAFYEKEGKDYRSQAIEEFGEFCIRYPYKQDMPRYQFATSHLLARNAVQFGDLVKRRLKVLDIGCQNGAFDVGWANLGFDVTAVDISVDYVEITNNSLSKFSWHSDWRVLQADILEDIGKIIPYGPFDVIMALEVVEHLPDVEDFMMVMSEEGLAAPNSKLIINVPGGDSWKEDPGHINSFWDNVPQPQVYGDGLNQVPDCFAGFDWVVSECERHQWSEKEYWYAVCLER